TGMAGTEEATGTERTDSKSASAAIAGTTGKGGKEEQAGKEGATGLGEGVRAITAGQLKKLVGYDPAKLEGMRRDGLLEYDDEGLWVTETGSMFIRNIAVLFDPAYSEQVNRYSKSV
ncbi:MAG: hypothetical protein LC655_05655, partial [Bacteroidales bacterium]|nr:hypothetical protein [Bacteroidales bacterium]